LLYQKNSLWLQGLSDCRQIYSPPWSIIETLLIGAEGTKTPPKMLTQFHRAWAGSRKQINVLRDQRFRGDLGEMIRVRNHLHHAGAKRWGSSPDAKEEFAFWKSRQLGFFIILPHGKRCTWNGKLPTCFMDQLNKKSCRQTWFSEFDYSL